MRSHGLLNPVRLVEAIKFGFNTSIDPGNSLIFFDEVQNTPSVLKMLRYIYEEVPECKILATGSLLEFVLDEPQFSIPVGRIELMYMGPFSFEEFLQVKGESAALDYIRGSRIGDKMTALLRAYVAV